MPTSSAVIGTLLAGALATGALAAYDPIVDNFAVSAAEAQMQLFARTPLTAAAVEGEFDAATAVAVINDNGSSLRAVVDTPSTSPDVVSVHQVDSEHIIFALLSRRGDCAWVEATLGQALPFKPDSTPTTCTANVVGSTYTPSSEIPELPASSGAI